MGEPVLFERLGVDADTGLDVVARDGLRYALRLLPPPRVRASRALGWVGPLPLAQGVAWLAPLPAAVGVDALAEAVDGLDAPALASVVDGLLDGLDGDLPGVDPEAWLVGRDGRAWLLEEDARDAAAPGRSLHEALTAVADGDALPGWLDAVRDAETVAEVARRLEGAPRDPDGLRRAVAMAREDRIVAVPGQTGALLAVGGAPAAPPRALVARVAGLTLVLGLAAGWWLAPRGPDPAVVRADGVDQLQVDCGDVRTVSRGGAPLRLPPSSRCTVTLRSGRREASGPLDIGPARKYRCQVREGEVACVGS